MQIVRRPAALSGVLLLIATAVAWTWANSSAADAYHGLWATKFQIGVGAWSLNKPLLLWVNDLLMAVFFLLVGLEIKREVFEGALTDLRQAALPLAGAFGGVAVPALVYAALNTGEQGVMDGWAVPAATDIAFALGILALIGNRVPLAMKVFLTTVAVVDDLCAVLIIAIFLTDSIALGALGIAAGTYLLLLALGRMGVRHISPYVLLGLVLWVALLKSGLHATIGGVLLASALPMSRGMRREAFLESLHHLAAPSKHESPHGLAPDSLADKVTKIGRRYASPVLRWEHGIQPWVLFGVVPIFALANAGVTLGGNVGERTLNMPVFGGIFLGLLVGKPVGITLFAWLAFKLKLADMPEGLTLGRIHALSWLGAIGFTMALFIAGIALDDTVVRSGRMGLLTASGLAAIIGAILVVVTTRKEAS